MKRFLADLLFPSFLPDGELERLGVYRHLYSESLGSEILEAGRMPLSGNETCENCPPIANRLTNHPLAINQRGTSDPLHRGYFDKYTEAAFESVFGDFRSIGESGPIFRTELG